MWPEEDLKNLGKVSNVMLDTWCFQIPGNKVISQYKEEFDISTPPLWPHICATSHMVSVAKIRR
jgi:hypothetical protein